MNKVLVAMSGGVDSAAAACILREQGHEVAGATFHLWKPTESTAAMQRDIDDARAICEALDITHHVLDYRELFMNTVVKPFIKAYDLGRTPNPCIFCNRAIKLGAFLNSARELGYDYIATGHYAQLEHGENGVRLRCAAHLPKDQSYVLYPATQEQLSHLMLPLGGITKDEARAVASKYNLLVQNRPESQDICFITDGNTGGFLDKYADATCPASNFVDVNGKVMGAHKGIRYYTIGQRKGLGISAERPVYVKEIDTASGNITLSDNDSLFSHNLTASEINWITPPDFSAPLRLSARIRYAHKPAPALIDTIDDNRIHLTFYEPQRAITRGQSVVFYDGDYLIGGGIID